MERAIQEPPRLLTLAALQLGAASRALLAHPGPVPGEFTITTKGGAFFGIITETGRIVQKDYSCTCIRGELSLVLHAANLAQFGAKPPA